MEGTQLPDQLVHWTIVALIGLLSWLFKKVFMGASEATNQALQQLREDFEAHVKDTNLLPRSLIIEKIDNLSQRIEDYHRDNREDITEIKESITELRKSVYRLGNGNSSH